MQTPKCQRRISMQFGSLIDFYYLSCVVLLLCLVFLFLRVFVAVAVGWLVWLGCFNRVTHSPARTWRSCSSTRRRRGCCSTRAQLSPRLVPVPPLAFFLGGRIPRSSAEILLPLLSPRTRGRPRRRQGSRAHPARHWRPRPRGTWRRRAGLAVPPAEPASLPARETSTRGGSAGEIPVPPSPRGGRRAG